MRALARSLTASALFFLVGAALVGQAEADLIRLKSGGEIRCTTIWKEGTMVNCAWTSGNLSFPETDVAEIIYDNNAGYAGIASSAPVLEAKTYGPGTAEAELVKAAGQGNVEGVRKLIAKGADVNGLYYSGSRFQLAPSSSGQSVNTVYASNGSGSGNTPLMLAASRGNTTIVRLLLEQGANPNLRSRLDDRGRSSALYKAVNASSVRQEVVRLLLSRNPDKESLETAFDYIAGNKYTIMSYVDLFLAHGISSQCRRRVLDKAKDRDHRDIVHLLEEAYRKHDEAAQKN